MYRIRALSEPVATLTGRGKYFLKKKMVLGASKK